uniref:Uncharacterized protein n=1 Tax=Arundo donax TaxID=35708 RepID=A0A0A9TH22_ARUDO
MFVLCASKLAAYFDFPSLDSNKMEKDSRFEANNKQQIKNSEEWRANGY